MAEGDMVLAAVRKNAGEQVLVRQTEFRGVALVDVRVFTIPRLPEEDPVPTKRGLSLRPETWREILPEIARALAWDGLTPALREALVECDGGE